MTEVSNVFLLAGGLCLVVSGMVLVVCIVLGDRAARLPKRNDLTGKDWPCDRMT